MKEFLGIGGYTREPEGYLSWQHILFVGLLLGAMFALSIWLGLRNRRRDDRTKNTVLIATAPLAAFTKRRVREAALDFVFIFGLLGAILGTVGAGQNYNAYPVLSLDNVASGLTHCISGFASLYIVLSGQASMKKRNIPITYAILGVFCVAAYVSNITMDTNYMFLMQGDGTPYDILYNLLGGSPILYPVGVVVLFLVYIAAFYGVFFLIQQKQKSTAAA